jgi:transposase
MSLEGILTASPVNVVNGACFLEILEHVILPAMNPFPLPKSVLVLDNASVHSKFNIEHLCQDCHVHVIFLPPFCYDFNAIELAFHLSKAWLRKYGSEGEDEAPLPERLVEALYKSVSKESACRMFKHCYIHVSFEDYEYVMR